MKSVLSVLLAISMLAPIPSAIAGDAAAGEATYAAKGCMGCHGPGGHSPNPETFPKTAGREESYLVTQLKAFRGGDRSNPMMSPMAANLTDEEIVNLAAFLSSQK
jgi:cytochrome c553